jgi:C-terminal processing protease CtpA/Prc
MRKAYKKLSSSSAIIIDLRKYGGGSERPLLRHLITKNFTYLHFYVQRDRFPGVYKKIKLTAIPFSFLPFYRKFKGDVLVLIDEQSASWMEALSMKYKLAGFTLIGRNTAGTDGDNQPFSFRPGFLTAFTKNAITYPDGKQTQRIGIIPDIYVKATYEDVKQGKDEILEKAIQYLDAKQKR